MFVSTWVSEPVPEPLVVSTDQRISFVAVTPLVLVIVPPVGTSMFPLAASEIVPGASRPATGTTRSPMPRSAMPPDVVTFAATPSGASTAMAVPAPMPVAARSVIVSSNEASPCEWIALLAPPEIEPSDDSIVTGPEEWISPLMTTLPLESTSSSPIGNAAVPTSPPKITPAAPASIVSSRWCPSTFALNSTPEAVSVVLSLSCTRSP